MKNPFCRLITRGRPLWISLALFVVTVSVPGPTRAATLAQPGPLDISGVIDGAPFRIIVPETWSGTLLVFADGNRDKADHPGEVDDRTPRLAHASGLRDALLGRGYALAGTAYKDNGWAVKEGLDDVVALTSYFRDNVAKPERTILWGISMGSIVVLKTAERTGGLFDGYLAACAPGAGTPRGVDLVGTLALAYDVAFGMPASWGTPGDVRDDLDFESEVFPKIPAEVGLPTNFGMFEFMRLVAGIPGSGLTPPDFPALSFPDWLYLDMFYATEARAELERRAGGPIVQNLNHTYSLTPAEKAYLAGLGVDADPLLAAINPRRDITAPTSPRNYVEHYAEFTGSIKNPVLTLHTVVDPLAVVSNESAYRETVEGAGRADLLRQAYYRHTQHCRFTGFKDAWLAAFGAIDEWARTGTPPAASDFPAALGFVENFVPPAWPQP